ncbi:MAG: rhodanese-like domain-containing protein [Betaproteobacteria bacterium]
MNFIQTNWLLLLVMFASGAMLLWPMIQRRYGPAKDVGTLNAIQLINRQNALVLDVRETAEYDGGHLPNAVHIPLSQLASRGGELAKHTARPVVACCATGNRSRMAVNALAKLGFTEIYNLQGGYRGWKDAGLPTEK